MVCITPHDVALLLFTACNSVRVFAYLPQIASVARDRNGASAISFTTWGMFAVSHVSTVGYAHFVVDDQRMVLIFTANALCCTAVVLLTAHKRGLVRLSAPFLLRRAIRLITPTQSADRGARADDGHGSTPSTAPQPRRERPVLPIIGPLQAGAR